MAQAGWQGELLWQFESGDSSFCLVGFFADTPRNFQGVSPVKASRQNSWLFSSPSPQRKGTRGPLAQQGQMPTYLLSPGTLVTPGAV